MAKIARVMDEATGWTRVTVERREHQEKRNKRERQPGKGPLVVGRRGEEAGLGRAGQRLMAGAWREETDPMTIRWRGKV